MPGERTSVYLAEDLAAAVKASGTSLAELVRRGLGADEAQPTEPAASPVSTTSGLLIGEPSPGVACMAPTCWERNTTRYGLRHVPICPADAAALEGRVYQRHPSAARHLSGAA